MSEIILSGVITAALTPQQGVSQRTQQPWVSQEFVLCHEQGQYPRSVCFRVFGQDKISQMGIRVGEQLTVHLNIDCKQSTSKPGQYFNSIDCWKVDRMAQPQFPQQPQQFPQQQFPQQQVAPFPQQQPTPMPQQPVAAPFPPTGQPAAAPFPQQPVAQPVAQPAAAPAPFPPQQPVAQQPVAQPAPQPAPQPTPQQPVQQPTQSPLPFPPAQ